MSPRATFSPLLRKIPEHVVALWLCVVAFWAEHDNHPAQYQPYSDVDPLAAWWFHIFLCTTFLLRTELSISLA